jgi:hypothetical protein
MVNADAAARLQRTWMWWSALDEPMQRILNDIAARAPQAVADVIGGPDANELVPPTGTAFGDFLWSVVSASSAPANENLGPARAQPDYVISKQFATMQRTYAPDATVTFAWAETNKGGRPTDRAPRRAKVVVQDAVTGDVLASAETTCGPLEPGRSREYDLAIPGLPNGTHWASLFVPYADGLESTPGAAAQPAITVTVGPIEGPAGTGVNEFAPKVYGAENPAELFGKAAELFAEAARLATDGENRAHGAAGAGLKLVDQALRAAGSEWPRPTEVALDLRRRTTIIPHLERMSITAARLRDSVLTTLAQGGSMRDSADVQALVQDFEELQKFGEDEYT